LNLANKNSTDTNCINKDDSGYFEPYAAFASRLRTWLAAYGIGAPVLIATHDALIDNLIKSGDAQVIIIVFLVGLAVQVFAALLYKTTMWYLYYGEHRGEFKKSKRYKLFDKISEVYWPELLFDLTTIVCYSWATFKILSISYN